MIATAGVNRLARFVNRQLNLLIMKLAVTLASILITLPDHLIIIIPL